VPLGAVCDCAGYVVAFGIDIKIGRQILTGAVTVAQAGGTEAISPLLLLALGLASVTRQKVLPISPKPGTNVEVNVLDAPLADPDGNVPLPPVELLGKPELFLKL
jgi:hypothetical protein